ncbi:MAG: MarR family transcriptional regulator [Gammaproteobacteria bacterium]|nr:MarR family transcriptional regulator [Gammaproteobacteria bacterium]NVK88112.1 MarR family transcriptional regulator [Gammaproteobacteria bacterium]
MSINLTQHLPFRLAVVANYLKRATSDSFVADTGLTGRDWRVLSLLHLQGAMTPAQLSDMTGLDRPTISRALKSLTQQAFIDRAEHQADGRSQIISITEQGQRLADRLMPAMLNSDQLYKSVLSSGETQLLLELLAKLEQQARAQLIQADDEY